MRSSPMSGRFRVGTRIYFGFLSILALLVAVAVIAVFGLGGARDGFDHYAEVSGESIDLAGIDGDVAQMRRLVVGYGATGDGKVAAEVRDVQAGLDRRLADMAQRVKPERVRDIENMQAVFQEYVTDFKQVVDKRELRDRLYDERMRPTGAKARDELENFLEQSLAQGNHHLAALLGLSQQELMTARLEAQRFLTNPTEQGAADVIARNARIQESLKTVGTALSEAADRQRLADISRLTDEYTEAFRTTSVAVLEVSDLVSKVMADLGAQFARLSHDILAAETRERNELLTRTNESMESSIAFTILIGVIAVVFGILLGVLVARSIVRPVTTMTNSMGQLADGDLEVEIPALENSDEIGRMARAVQVFKENAMEKRRMDLAERERLEAERQADEEKRRREADIGREIAELIDGVSKGDLMRRLDLADKDGFYRSMSEGINRLTDTVESVIDDLGEVLGALAQGDLNKRVTRIYAGAFDKLKTDVNATATTLTEIVGQIRSATDAISSASSEVALGSNDLADRTEQQASSLEETAASMEELGATVRTSADNAHRANSMAGEARGAAESGGVVATSAIDAMKKIEDSSRRITDIIGVIDEIAFQTNLLALNAAVEAARAGDAGRGFAVVAQEVRNLAQRSAQASKEIKGLILDSDAQVKDGVELVKRAGNALDGIVNGVQQVASLISEMAQASAEQATALDEINATVAQMDEMTQKNAALVEETTASAQALAHQAGDLRGLVSFFKLDAREAEAAGALRVAAGQMSDLAAGAGYGGGSYAGSGRASRQAGASAVHRSGPAKPAVKPVASPASKPPVRAERAKTAAAGRHGAAALLGSSQGGAPARLSAGGTLQRASASEDDWKEF